MSNSNIPTSPIGFILYITKSHRFLLFIVIFSILISEALGAFIPLILGRIIDTATSITSPEEITFASIGFLVFLYPLFRFLIALAIRANQYSLHYLTAHMRSRAYRLLFEHLSLHSVSYFNNRFAGSISSDVGVVGQNMSRIARFFSFSLLGLAFTIITGFIVIATANMNLAWMFLFGILVLVPVNYFLSKKTIRLSKIAVRTMSVLRGQVVDSITNISAVQQFAMRDKELTRLDESIKNHEDTDVEANVYGETVLLINNILVMAFVGALVFVAFSLWKSGGITLGQFIMVITLTATIVRSLTHIGNSINEFASIYGQTKHTLEEVFEEHGIKDNTDAKELHVKKGDISFSDTSFSYDETTAVFDKLSVDIKSGERIGIVGPSGGGKTTLIKLLLRQYDLNGGAITIDGQNISEVTQESLRKSVGIVPQDTALFHRTLFENIAYGKDDATLEEVINAAKKAQIHDFIESLPDKYETLAGERGIKLSGGQRQRVAIARAILKAAPILILDEATSALDSETENCIQLAFKELMEGKTVFAIAHRLSTIQEMDRIIVFEDGKIMQDGSHIELLKEKSGTYARLWGHQAGGFIPDESSASAL